MIDLFSGKRGKKAKKKNMGRGVYLVGSGWGWGVASALKKNCFAKAVVLGSFY